MKTLTLIDKIISKGYAKSIDIITENAAATSLTFEDLTRAVNANGKHNISDNLVPGVLLLGVDPQEVGAVADTVFDTDFGKLYFFEYEA